VRSRPVLPIVLAALALGAAAAGPAHAIPWDVSGAVSPARTPPVSGPDPGCAQSYADDAPRGGPPIRFGIGPRPAGEAGLVQTTPLTPQDSRKRDAALVALRGDRSLTVRLNRMFSADGARGIAHFKALAEHYARLGLKVELQVRYHPTAAHDGDMAAWLGYVRDVVRAFGPIHAVTGLQITNEVNLKISPNTSDGAYRNPVAALVRGVIAAKREARRLHHDQLAVGFNFAWRSAGAADADFFRSIRSLGGTTFLRALDWVGIDIYPATFVPGILYPAPVTNLGDAFLEGLAQARECYLPLAGIGRSTPIRVEETGYPTGPGRTEAAQLSALGDIVRTAVAYRGTYNVSDLRWFGLRDNNEHGPTFQSFFGLLRDDYSPKPAWALYRRLVARDGAPRAP
jgi:hypothetical protein